MTRYSYFPGCSADSTGKPYTIANAFVTRRIDVELVEIPDWNCCGTSAASLTSDNLAVALPARSLALSERANPDMDVVAPCAGCYRSLKKAVSYARTSQQNLEFVRDMVQLPYEAKANVLNMVEVLSTEEARNAIAAQVQQPMDCLKVACYYGCALVRPAGVLQFDDPEDPHSMEDLMSIVGCEPIDWAFKTECCGAAQQNAVPQPSRPLIRRIFENAAANGADCIVTACPLCLLNLDMRADEINRQRQSEGLEALHLPVFYFTEIIAMAMGAKESDLGLNMHFQPTSALLARRQHDSAAKAERERVAAAEKARKQAEIAEKLAQKKAQKEAAENAAAEAASADAATQEEVSR